MPRKFTLDEVRVFFDTYNVPLLSTEYVDIYTPLEFICPNCDNVGKVSLSQLRHYKDSKPLCESCRKERFRLGQRKHRLKYTIEDVRRDFEACGAKLVSTVYKSTSTPLEYVCSTSGCNNHGFITYMAFLQSKNKELICDACKHPITIQHIKKEFEEKGAKLITKEYKKTSQPLEFVCSNPDCNNVHHITWLNYHYNKRNQKLLCPSCMGIRDNEKFIDEIRREFASKGATLITATYINNRQPLEFTCSKCGRHHFISYHAYAAGTNKNLLCSKCCWDSHPEINEIAEIFESHGAKLLTTKYKNAHSKLKFLCSHCGNEWEISWDAYRRGINPDLLCQNCYKGYKVMRGAENFSCNKESARRDFVNKYWRYFYIPEFFNVSDVTGNYNMHHIIPYSVDERYRNSITNGYPLRIEEHMKKSRFYHKTPEGRNIGTWTLSAKLPYHDYVGFKFLDFNSVVIADVVFNKTSMQQNELYLKKQQLNENGIFYIPFFLTELFTKEKREIAYSMIRNRLNKWFPDVYRYTGIALNRFFARKLKIALVDSSEAKRFFEGSHIQGFVGAKVFIGLFDKEKLVSCMAFSTPRSVGANYPQWELVRYATLINTQVVGGASKLFKYFVDTYKPDSIVSFCDLRFSSLNPEETVYHKLGFKFEGRTRPNYRYRDPVYYQTFSRQSFQKSKLSKKLAEYRDDLSESELMSLNGYIKQYDCGNFKFVWRNTECEVLNNV